MVSTCLDVLAHREVANVKNAERRQLCIGGKVEGARDSEFGTREFAGFRKASPTN